MPAAGARVQQDRDLVLGHKGKHWVLVYTPFLLVPLGQSIVLNSAGVTMYTVTYRALKV